MTKDKSVSLALVLAFFFGPLGLFYATTGGAITLLHSRRLVSYPRWARCSFSCGRPPWSG
jgi:hypothetical protein